MPIPPGALLRAELHCLSHDGAEVITAQRWSDPSAPARRPRSWLRLVRNGQVEQDVRFVGTAEHAEMIEFWAQREKAYAATRLDGPGMWIKLRELAGAEQVECGQGCPGRLPVAWPVCLDCGRDSRMPVAGTPHGVRRRPTLTLDLRKAPKP
jgi:hypothetical protein